MGAPSSDAPSTCVRWRRVCPSKGRGAFAWALGGVPVSLAAVFAITTAVVEICPRLRRVCTFEGRGTFAWALGGVPVSLAAVFAFATAVVEMCPCLRRACIFECTEILAWALGRVSISLASVFAFDTGVVEVCLRLMRPCVSVCERHGAGRLARVSWGVFISLAAAVLVFSDVVEAFGGVVRAEPTHAEVLVSIGRNVMLALLTLYCPLPSPQGGDMSLSQVGL